MWIVSLRLIGFSSSRAIVEPKLGRSSSKRVYSAPSSRVKSITMVLPWSVARSKSDSRPCEENLVRPAVSSMPSLFLSEGGSAIFSYLPILPPLTSYLEPSAPSCNCYSVSTLLSTGFPTVICSPSFASGSSGFILTLG